jgi:type I site-specific restriction endonuclease
MATPEDLAREHIDQALEQTGWKVQDYKSANLRAGRGVVLRNFPLQSGHGSADYLLYLDGKAAEKKKKKKEGFPLIGVNSISQVQRGSLLSYRHITVAPFLYQSTGVETHSRMASIRNPEVVKPLDSTSPIRWRNGLLNQGTAGSSVRDDLAALKWSHTASTQHFVGSSGS